MGILDRIKHAVTGGAAKVELVKHTGNLAPGEITHPSSELSPDTAMYQAWRVQGDGSDGFLFASAYFTGDGAAPIVDEGGTVEELANVPDGQAWLAFEPGEGDQFVAPSLWWARSDGSTWVFQQQGLYSAVSDNQWVDLVFAAQPGSGVPIVLPDPRATLLIVGSGNIVHNLRLTRRGTAANEAYDWAAEFDTVVQEQIKKGQLGALQDFQKLRAVAQQAHPTHEHYLPLLYAAGAVESSEMPRFFNTGYQSASISMRSVLWG